MGEEKHGVNIQAAYDSTKRALDFSGRGDYKHAFFELVIAVNRLGMELENVNDVLVIHKLAAPEK